MKSVMSSGAADTGSLPASVEVSKRAQALADRLEQGTRSLAALASTLTDEEWQTRLAGDGRKVGVVVHHVASVLPVEIHLAQTLAAGKPVKGITMETIHEMNAVHARDYAAVAKDTTLDLLGRNGAAAAAAIRALTDDQLDSAAPASLYADATLTCQFMLEDHAVRHSYHHLARIKRALQRER